MKAKDLAALAALGMAGFAAYNKFGKKSPANSGAKAGAKLGDDERDGEAGEREARKNMRDMNEGSGRRDAGGNTEKLSRQELDVPERMKDISESRQERDVPPSVGGFFPRDKEGLIKRNSVNLQGGNDGSASAAAAAKAAKEAKDAKAAADAAAKSLNSTGGPSRPKGKAIAADSDAEDAVEVAPKTRVFTPPGAQASMGAFTNAGQAGASSPGTRAFTPPGYVASANDYNRASTTNTPSNAALGDYTRAFNPAMQADRGLGASHPSAKITDKLAVDSRVNQAAYLAKKQAEQARLDALRIGRRAKGGMVKKMASGGMTSSKPSTASSRGDGIAQRGKTRGKLC